MSMKQNFGSGPDHGGKKEKKTGKKDREKKAEEDGGGGQRGLKSCHCFSLLSLLLPARRKSRKFFGRKIWSSTFSLLLPEEKEKTLGAERNFFCARLCVHQKAAMSAVDRATEPPTTAPPNRILLEKLVFGIVAENEREKEGEEERPPPPQPSQPDTILCRNRVSPSASQKGWREEEGGRREKPQQKSKQRKKWEEEEAKKGFVSILCTCAQSLLSRRESTTTKQEADNNSILSFFVRYLFSIAIVRLGLKGGLDRCHCLGSIAYAAGKRKEASHFW